MKREKNNKGFSLVELIIVIAIMVILVAVIVPQYLKYVNNSKISVDVQTASEMATAIDVAVASRTGAATVFASSTADTLSHAGITTVPASKYFGTAVTWTISGNDEVGVQQITIQSSAGGSPSPTVYEIYPDPDNSSNGFHEKLKK